MAAASTEPHPSSPARPASLSPAPKLLPRDKQTRRQGRPPPLLPPPRSPPLPGPGPVRAPASELRLQPQPQRARARARGGGVGSQGSSSLPPAPGTSGPAGIRRRVLEATAAPCARRWALSRARPPTGRCGEDELPRLAGISFDPALNFPYLKSPLITPLKSRDVGCERRPTVSPYDFLEVVAD